MAGKLFRPRRGRAAGGGDLGRAGAWSSGPILLLAGVKLPAGLLAIALCYFLLGYLVLRQHQ